MKELQVPEGKEYIEVKLSFNREDLEKLHERFFIENISDLRSVCYECINFYLNY